METITIDIDVTKKVKEKKEIQLPYYATKENSVFQDYMCITKEGKSVAFCLYGGMEEIKNNRYIEHFFMEPVIEITEEEFMSKLKEAQQKILNLIPTQLP